MASRKRQKVRKGNCSDCGEQHILGSYRCPKCDHISSCPALLEIHMEDSHGCNLEYPCPFCDVVSIDYPLLETHVTQGHGIVIVTDEDYARRKRKRWSSSHRSVDMVDLTCSDDETSATARARVGPRNSSSTDSEVIIIEDSARRSNSGNMNSNTAAPTVAKSQHSVDLLTSRIDDVLSCGNLGNVERMSSTESSKQDKNGVTNNVEDSCKIIDSHVSSEKCVSENTPSTSSELPSRFPLESVVGEVVQKKDGHLESSSKSTSVFLSAESLKNQNITLESTKAFTQNCSEIEEDLVTEKNKQSDQLDGDCSKEVLSNTAKHTTNSANSVISDQTSTDASASKSLAGQAPQVFLNIPDSISVSDLFSKGIDKVYQKESVERPSNSESSEQSPTGKSATVICDQIEPISAINEPASCNTENVSSEHTHKATNERNLFELNLSENAPNDVVTAVIEGGTIPANETEKTEKTVKDKQKTGKKLPRSSKTLSDKIVSKMKDRVKMAIGKDVKKTNLLMKLKKQAVKVNSHLLEKMKSNVEKRKYKLKKNAKEKKTEKSKSDVVNENDNENDKIEAIEDDLDDFDPQDVHYINVSPDETFRCTKCNNMWLKGMFQVRTHVYEKHLPMKPYSCSNCEFSDKTPERLVNHFMTSHFTEKSKTVFNKDISEMQHNAWSLIHKMTMKKKEKLQSSAAGKGKKQTKSTSSTGAPSKIAHEIPTPQLHPVPSIAVPQKTMIPENAKPQFGPVYKVAIPRKAPAPKKSRSQRIPLHENATPQIQKNLGPKKAILQTQKEPVHKNAKPLKRSISKKVKPKKGPVPIIAKPQLVPAYAPTVVKFQLCPAPTTALQQSLVPRMVRPNTARAIYYPIKRLPERFYKVPLFKSSSVSGKKSTCPSTWISQTPRIGAQSQGISTETSTHTSRISDATTSSSLPQASTDSSMTSSAITSTVSPTKNERCNLFRSVLTAQQNTSSASTTSTDLTSSTLQSEILSSTPTTTSSSIRKTQLPPLIMPSFVRTKNISPNPLPPLLSVKPPAVQTASTSLTPATPSSSFTPTASTPLSTVLAPSAFSSQSPLTLTPSATPQTPTNVLTPTTLQTSPPTLKPLPSTSVLPSSVSAPTLTAIYMPTTTLSSSVAHVVPTENSVAAPTSSHPVTQTLNSLQTTSTSISSTITQPQTSPPQIMFVPNNLTPTPVSPSKTVFMPNSVAQNSSPQFTVLPNDVNVILPSPVKYVVPNVQITNSQNTGTSTLKPTSLFTSTSVSDNSRINHPLSFSTSVAKQANSTQDAIQGVPVSNTSNVHVISYSNNSSLSNVVSTKAVTTQPAVSNTKSFTTVTSANSSSPFATQFSDITGVAALNVPDSSDILIAMTNDESKNPSLKAARTSLVNIFCQICCSFKACMVRRMVNHICNVHLLFEPYMCNCTRTCAVKFKVLTDLVLHMCQHHSEYPQILLLEADELKRQNAAWQKLLPPELNEKEMALRQEFFDTNFHPVTNAMHLGTVSQKRYRSCISRNTLLQNGFDMAVMEKDIVPVTKIRSVDLSIDPTSTVSGSSQDVILVEDLAKTDESALCFKSLPNGQYQCKTCDRVCKDFAYLFNHGKTVHEKQSPYSCSVCQKKYNIAGDAICHMFDFHNFMNKSQLKVHIDYNQVKFQEKIVKKKYSSPMYQRYVENYSKFLKTCLKRDFTHENAYGITCQLIISKETFVHLMPEDFVHIYTISNGTIRNRKYVERLRASQTPGQQHLLSYINELQACRLVDGTLHCLTNGCSFTIKEIHLQCFISHICCIHSQCRPFQCVQCSVNFPSTFLYFVHIANGCRSKQMVVNIESYRQFKFLIQCISTKINMNGCDVCGILKSKSFNWFEAGSLDRTMKGTVLYTVRAEEYSKLIVYANSLARINEASHARAGPSSIASNSTISNKRLSVSELAAPKNLMRLNTIVLDDDEPLTTSNSTEIVQLSSTVRSTSTLACASSSETTTATEYAASNDINLSKTNDSVTSNLECPPLLITELSIPKENCSTMESASEIISLTLPSANPSENISGSKSTTSNVSITNDGGADVLSSPPVLGKTVKITDPSGETIYCCPKCEFQDGKIRKFLKHFKSQHLKYRPFQCMSCEFRCEILSDFLVHSYLHRDNGEECKLNVNIAEHEKQAQALLFTLEEYELGEHFESLVKFQKQLNKKYLTEIESESCDHSKVYGLDRTKMKEILSHIAGFSGDNTDFNDAGGDGHTKITLSVKALEKVPTEQDDLNVDKIRQKLSDFDYEKSINCFICRFDTKSEDEIIDHFRSSHIRLTPFSCKICDLRDKSSKKITEHVKSKHWTDFKNGDGDALFIKIDDGELKKQEESVKFLLLICCNVPKFGLTMYQNIPCKLKCDDCAEVSCIGDMQTHILSKHVDVVKNKTITCMEGCNKVLNIEVIGGHYHSCHPDHTCLWALKPWPSEPIQAKLTQCLKKVSLCDNQDVCRTEKHLAKLYPALEKLIKKKLFTK